MSSRRCKLKRFTAYVGSAILILAFACTAHAAELTVQCRLQDERPLQEAPVVVRTAYGENVVTARTGRDGTFTFTNLKPGTYEVTVHSPRRGTPLAQAGIELREGSTSRIDMTVRDRRPLWASGSQPIQ
jgi:hypothetical protein